VTSAARDFVRLCVHCGTPLSAAHLETIVAHPDRRYLCEGWGCRVMYWWAEGELHWTAPL
jgi:hypothetical protein